MTCNDITMAHLLLTHRELEQTCLVYSKCMREKKEKLCNYFFTTHITLYRISKNIWSLPLCMSIDVVHIEYATCGSLSDLPTFW